MRPRRHRHVASELQRRQGYALLPTMDIHVQRRAAAGGAGVLRCRWPHPRRRLSSEARAWLRAASAQPALRRRSPAGSGRLPAGGRLRRRPEAQRAPAQRLLAHDARAAAGRRGRRRFLGVPAGAALQGAEAGAQNAPVQGLRLGAGVHRSLGQAPEGGQVLRSREGGNERIHTSGSTCEGSSERYSTYTTSVVAAELLRQPTELLRKPIVCSVSWMRRATASVSRLRPPASVSWLRRDPAGLGAPHRRRAVRPGLLRDRLPEAVLPRHPEVRDTRDDPEDQDAAERGGGGSGRWRRRPALQRAGDFCQRHGEGRRARGSFGERGQRSEEGLGRDERLRPSRRGGAGDARDGQGQEAAADGPSGGHQHLTNILPGAAVRATVARRGRGQRRRGGAGPMRAGGGRPVRSARHTREGPEAAHAQCPHRIHLVAANHGLLPFVC